jgi:hypothetical protein
MGLNNFDVTFSGFDVESFVFAIILSSRGDYVRHLIMLIEAVILF